MLALPAPLREAIDARGTGLSILVLRLGAMGDIVRTLPAVRLVRSGLPHARIHWAAWEPWTQLLTTHPDVDTVVGLPRSKLRALARSPVGWPSLAGAAGRIATQLRSLHAGLVLDFHGDLRSGFLGRLSGAPVRLGYDGHQQKEGNRLFTTHRVPADERRTPRLTRNLELVSALGLPARPVPTAGITIDGDASSAADSIVRSLVGGGGYAVLNPGASRRQAYKKPPAPLFAAAARALADHCIPAIVVSGPGEETDADRVIAAAGGGAHRAPATSLATLAALLHGARVFVGGDSGPLHLACGVGCPVVGLYGPTDPVVNTPWNVPFVALARPGSSHTGIKRIDRVTEGFGGLAPEAVVDAIRVILAQPRDASTAP
jgi:ADP-heptose:LPS heptosyltransferase